MTLKSQYEGIRKQLQRELTDEERAALETQKAEVLAALRAERAAAKAEALGPVEVEPTEAEILKAQAPRSGGGKGARSRTEAIFVLQRDKVVGVAGQCRGKWSACGGTNPSVSDRWHLCKECTDARKTAKAAPAK